MATEAQIAANRRNAEHSTGPKTLEGKEKSHENALKHGLSARHPVALGEDEEDFLRYWESFVQSAHPQNAVEAALIRRAALCGWRLERLYFIEAALFDRKSSRESRIHGHDEDRGLAAWPDEMGPLARYEAMLDRGFHRALRELDRMQRSRPYRIPSPSPLIGEGRNAEHERGISGGGDGDDDGEITPTRLAAASRLGDLPHQGGGDLSDVRTKRSQSPPPNPPPQAGEGRDREAFEDGGSRRDETDLPPYPGANPNFAKRSQFAETSLATKRTQFAELLEASLADSSAGPGI